jgi:hypothetical protein
MYCKRLGESDWPRGGAIVAEDKCLHRHRATGILNCDLSRTDQSGSTYSAQLEVKVCEECGQVEVWSKAHRDLCNWLRQGQRPST